MITLSTAMITLCTVFWARCDHALAEYLATPSHDHDVTAVRANTWVMITKS